MLTVNSLERLIGIFLLLVNLLILGLSVACLWLLHSSGLMLATLLVLLLPAQLLVSLWLNKKLLCPYARILDALESMKVDDYSLQVRPVYCRGMVGRVFDEIGAFSAALRQKKRLFDEKNLLVHSLIKQLDSPVLLLDEERKLVHGNQALSRWLGKDWRLVRLSKAKSLGLVQSASGWLIADKQQARQFNIRSSFYKDETGEHQLLIFTDISHELREMQIHSWQQIVRVLSHEIKNSLTPIKSLAQTLAEFSTHQVQKDMLEVINQRSQKLTEFVGRYSQLSRQYAIHPQHIDLPGMLGSVMAMYSDITFELQLDSTQVVADPVLLEQVLINLITNARQAIAENTGEGVIKVHCYSAAGAVLISLSDNGVGIQNPDNVFVPFYTTKRGGQGIGLLLSRQIIEQHGGQLTLENNADGVGAVALIRLPVGC
ncbi:sensor histidine kinase [Bowmanella denitrificans]|uniref:sensor histidine kinase n=1 Tax=Bowmanella denitrificans TaxID=366582 RepID=UPI000C9B7B87|nr:ATP-binding protein [Bowmanella denitrificans]